MARGVILTERHLLVAHCKGMDNTFLPGGHVEFQESIRSSLYREIKEELGLSSEVHNLLPEPMRKLIMNYICGTKGPYFESTLEDA
nr:NUDIX domain-containing protein [Paenibacillus timonensis]